MYELIGKGTVLFFVAYAVYLVMRMFNKYVEKRHNERLDAIRKEKEIRDFQNKIWDKDLQREWISFLESKTNS
jgi:hypothetical protein